MLIHEIKVINFCARGSAVLALPETGVTVLTGPNGAGKSRFIEAVAYAHWGETLRDETPWIEGEAGRVEVETGLGLAARTVTAKGTKGLTWQGEKADTPTRTQELIVASVPDFDFWKRTHVFSSTEAASFSGATDGARKRVMELLLGLDVFDRAQRECLDETAAVNVDLLSIKVKLAEAQGRLAVAAGQLESFGTWADYVPSQPPQEPPAPVSVVELMAQIEDAKRIKAELREQTQVPLDTHYLRAVNETHSALIQLQARLALAQSGRCDKCGQDWHGASIEALEKDFARLRKDHTFAKQAEQKYSNERTAQLADAHNDLRTVEHELDTLSLQLQTAGRAHAAHDEWKRQQAGWAETERQRAASWEQARLAREVKVRAANAALRDAQDECSELNEAIAQRQELLDELGVTARVLGVKGLRGHVLGRALEGVEYVANYWLQQIAPGHALTLRAEGEAGKIVLGVQGYGGGRYKAASQGEKRRIDAPLLLALAEIAGAGERGTLFLDEVFDALDEDGVDLVARALGDLGLQQSVVVITHSERLAALVPATQRFRVQDGSLERL